MEGWALLVAFLALAFSVFSFIRQFSLQRRVTEIEEARRQEEVQARLAADVVAAFETFISSRGTKGYQFILGNRGPAIAEDVSFEFVRTGGGETPGLVMEGHHFPIRLDPGQQYAVHAIMVMGTAPAVEVVLRWRDGNGAREKSMTLTVF
jgi:hypothetical protein